MLCRKRGVGPKHRAGHGHRMLLSCVLTVSLFHVKPVVHFVQCLASSVFVFVFFLFFCRLLFLTVMSRKGKDAVNVGGLHA